MLLKLVLLVIGQANKSRDKVLGQRKVTLFSKSANQEGGEPYP